MKNLLLAILLLILSAIFFFFSKGLIGLIFSIGFSRFAFKAYNEWKSSKKPTSEK